VASVSADSLPGKSCLTVYFIVFTSRRSCASAVLGVVILFVCLSVRLSHLLTYSLKTKQCTADTLILTQQKGNHSSFLTPSAVGGRRSLPSEICAQSDPPSFEKRQLRQISANNVSAVLEYASRGLSAIAQLLVLNHCALVNKIHTYIHISHSVRKFYVSANAIYSHTMIPLLLNLYLNFHGCFFSHIFSLPFLTYSSAGLLQF